MKNGAALVGSQGLHLLTQLLLPPAFLLAYGVQGYGEWLVLGAAIGFLTTLDFGLQTYVLNELTVLFNRQDMGRLHRLQSTGLRMLLGIVASAAVLGLVVFLVPLKEILNLSLSAIEISLVLYVLALYLLANIASGYVYGVFRVFGKAHRGAMWHNAQRVVVLIATLMLVWMRAPLWVVALGQLTAAVISVFPPLLDLRGTAPTVFPTMRYWDRRLAKDTVKPSAYFGLFSLNNFLLFQVPLLIINQMLGTTAVVTFTIARMLYSFVRQGVSMIQWAIAPEITRLHGIRDFGRLARLYKFSESAALTAALILNFGAFLVAPALLWVWLRRPELFDYQVFLLLAVISILMSAKEYKLYLQYATNNHVTTSILTFASYSTMCLIAIPVTEHFGLSGFLVTWILVEILQIPILHRYNLRLLPDNKQISIVPVVNFGLLLLLTVSMLLGGRQVYPVDDFIEQAIGALVVILMLLGASYLLFGLKDVLAEAKAQIFGA